MLNPATIDVEIQHLEPGDELAFFSGRSTNPTYRKIRRVHRDPRTQEATVYWDGGHLTLPFHRKVATRSAYAR